jgi:hypothetical protein
MHGREVKCILSSGGNPEGRLLEDRVDGSIILKKILKKYDGSVWTGFD